MKYSTLGISLLIASNIFAQTTQNISSKINDVTVFMAGGAQITRQASVNLPQGTATIVFNKLSPNINDETIQIKAPNGITILSVKHQINYFDSVEKSADIKKLEEQIEKLNQSIKTEETNLAIVNEEITFLKENKKVTNNTTLSVQSLRDAYTFYGDKMKALKYEELNLNNKIKELKDQRTQAQNQLKEANKKVSNKENTSEIQVKVETKKAQNTKFTLTYMVNGATWTPTYDIRVSEVGKPLSISYKANIVQNTKIDWENVNLKLSSAEPNISGEAPQMSTYYLNYITEAPKQLKSSSNGFGRRKMAAGSVANIVDDIACEADEAYELELIPIEEEAPMVQKNSFIPHQTQNQTATEFVINKPYTIKSGNKAEVVNMIEYNIPTEYQYLSIPKLNNNVYLTASITDWQQYNLLEGDANIYYEGTFVGNTILNTREYSDTLKVSLGVDKNISIKRESIKDVSKEQFFGSKATKNKNWKITVKNNKQQAIKLTVLDQVPISKNQDIEVTVGDISNGKRDMYTGKIEWNMDLEPQMTKELRLNYSVKYSKNRTLHIE